MAAVIGVQPALGQSVSVTAKGTVTPSCSLAPLQAFPDANLYQGGGIAASTRVSCNQYFKISATSTKGALKTSSPPRDFLVNSLAYSLKVDVPLDNGATAHGDCDAATLLAGQTSCVLSPAHPTGLTSQSQIATNKTVALTAYWSQPPGNSRLVPGTYSDTITLSIATVP